MTSKRRRRGGTMVEGALALTALIMLLIGTIELGRAVWVYNTLAFAARQGMRFAMVRGSVTPATDAGVKSVVTGYAVGLDANKLTVTTLWTPDRQRGSLVQVQVSYPFDFAVSPALGSAGTINMRSTTTGIVSQ